MFHVKHAPTDLGGVSRETRERLTVYVDLLLRWQRTINLISARDTEQVWTRHIDDSLQLAMLIPDGTKRAIDLGSGAGLPGLVLAIATGVAFELVEADQRKAAFLREAARITSANTTVHATRIRSSFDRPGPVDHGPRSRSTRHPPRLGLATARPGRHLSVPERPWSGRRIDRCRRAMANAHPQNPQPNRPLRHHSPHQRDRPCPSSRVRHCAPPPPAPSPPPPAPHEPLPRRAPAASWQSPTRRAASAKPPPASTSPPPSVPPASPS